MLRLIADFDGPIMDVSERYYRVYQFCVAEVKRPAQAVNPLSKAEFWSLKRAQVPERQIARQSGFDDEQAAVFARLRRDTVHTLPYLKYDCPVPGAIAALERARDAGWQLAVMTMRRERELRDAFDRYDLGRFFPEPLRYCLSNDYVKTKDVDDKPLLMARAMQELEPAAETWMVGDTEADIAAARKAGIPILSVLSGIRDRQRLEQYRPDAIVENLDAAESLILSGSLSHLARRIAPDPQP